MIVFENKSNEGDVPYLKWLENNPEGFVLQTRKKPDPEYMNLHSAKCKMISRPTNSTKSSPFTAEGFIKICSLNSSELFQYSMDYGRAHRPKISKCCARFIDSSVSDLPNDTNSESVSSSNLLLVELSKRAKSAGRSSPKMELSPVNRFIRSNDVLTYAKAVADGVCSLCGCNSELDPMQFLDCHHIVFLRDGGSDTRENVVAVCPNCHRKLHIAPDSETVENLTLLAKTRAEKLDKLR
jgi:5-methylcytosine-specific restriction endonuclease McrA